MLDQGVRRRFLESMVSSTDPVDDMSAILVKLRKRLGFGMWAKLHVTGMHVQGKEKLQDSIHDSSESAKQAFESLSQGMEALLRCVLKQNNPTLDDEAIDIMIANAIANENSATMPYSSTSTHTPNIEKVITEDEDHFKDVEEE
ncbi:hypothetical protein SESBI_11480 [Sesbania bispinosa]|nr:hypothetical protein SESBI_11480 [Sesbania bispinosa]